MTLSGRVWLARAAAVLVLLLWAIAFCSLAYETCRPHAMLGGTQPACIWFGGSYAALGEPGGGGFDRLSTLAWCANIVMVALVRMLLGAVPWLVLALSAPLLALVEAWPRTDRSFGYPITLAHGIGYWLWLAASAVPLILWIVCRLSVDRRGTRA